MKLLLRLIVMSLVAGGWVSAEEAPSENTKRASELKLEKIRFSEATLREVVDFLSTKANREKSAVNIIIVTPEDPLLAGDGGPIPPAPDANPPRIILEREGASVLDILREAAAQVFCEVQPEPGALIVRKKGAARIPPLRVPVGEEMILKKLDAIIFPRVEFAGSTVREAVQFIILKSKQLDPDGEGVGMVMKLDDAGQNIPPPQAAAPAVGGIPGLEAVGNAGVPAPARAGGSASRITLKATNISAHDLYRYIAASAGLDVGVEEYRVVIRPRRKSELRDSR
jgi:hypothetical protein